LAPQPARTGRLPPVLLVEDWAGGVETLLLKGTKPVGRPPALPTVPERRGFGMRVSIRRRS